MGAIGLQAARNELRSARRPAVPGCGDAPPGEASTGSSQSSAEQSWAVFSAEIVMDQLLCIRDRPTLFAASTHGIVRFCIGKGCCVIFVEDPRPRFSVRLALLFVFSVAAPSVFMILPPHFNTTVPSRHMYMCGLVLAPFYFWLFYRLIVPTAKFQNESSWARKGFIFFLLPLCSLMLGAFPMMAFAKAYTLLFGQPVEREIVVAGKKAGRKDFCAWQLGHEYLPELKCMTSAEYAPYHGKRVRMYISGKRSAMGEAVYRSDIVGTVTPVPLR